MSPSLSAGGDRKHWWLTNRKVVERYVREAKMLIATQDQSDIAAALGLLEAALSLAPRMEVARVRASRGGALLGAAHGGGAGAESALFALSPALQGGGGYVTGLYSELENGGRKN